MTTLLPDRLLIQVELALTADDPRPGAHEALELRARDSGLTGAEIDAARRGRCFDVRVAAAVAFALEVRGADGDQVRAARIRAAEMGLAAPDLDGVEGCALRLRGGRSTAESGADLRRPG